MQKRSTNSNTILGTRISGHTSQILTSSGIPALDDLIGGGLPVGAVALIEEDTYGSYSKIMLKYFLAEGIVNKHVVYLASQDLKPFNIIRELPAAISKEVEDTKKPPDSSNNSKMTIAFRYENLPTQDIKESTKNLGHFFDLTKVISQSDIDDANIKYWDGIQINNNCPSSFINTAFSSLLNSIKREIDELMKHVKSSNVLRIGIHSLGSPMWLPYVRTNDYGDSELSKDLVMFLFCLRNLVRLSNAVALITLPSRFYNKNTLERCIHSCDISMKLESFAGTELEDNKALSEYHGYFNLTKLAPINAFSTKHPGSVEHVFKLRRKKFVIEKLHLPPDLEDDPSDKKKTPSMGCFSKNNVLDF